MTPLGLYVHVPFCRCKCDWCAFASEPSSAGADPRVDAWLHRLVDQLDRPPVADASWATVYLGGGTPSLLSPEHLDRLLDAVGRRLVPGAELTFEANPESLVDDHLAVLSDRGGTRLSLGVQSFQDELLARHGRPTRRRHLEAARRLVTRWGGRVSLDLIAGLEGQTEAGQRRDLEEALDWGPDHISFYSLTVEPGTPLAHRAARGSVLPDEDEAARWWLEGRDFLESSGLAAYEVSNFARPGAESVHNGRYWSLEPWWGLGPSATSYLEIDGAFEYRTEAPALGPWLKRAPAEVERPTALERAKDALLVGLRRTKGVSSTPWVDLLPATLGAWQGRVRVEDRRLFLTREAFPSLDSFLRTAFAELDRRPEFR